MLVYKAVSSPTRRSLVMPTCEAMKKWSFLSPGSRHQHGCVLFWIPAIDAIAPAEAGGPGGMVLPARSWRGEIWSLGQADTAFTRDLRVPGGESFESGNAWASGVGDRAGPLVGRAEVLHT